MKTLACTALVFILTACSPLDVIKQVSSHILPTEKGLSVDAQIGDRDNELQLSGAKGISGDITAEDDATVVVNTSSHETAAQIKRAEVVNIEQIPPWVLLLLILGWVLPTPTGIFRGAREWLARIRLPVSLLGSKVRSRSTRTSRTSR